jgi:hypothetical protein
VEFYHWLQGDYKKITLIPGGSEEHRTGGRNEEGYSYTSYQFEHEGDLIRLQIASQAQDCDGRLDTYSEFTCSLDKLAARPASGGYDLMLPEWEKVDSHQRDYAAEAAGY